MADNKYVFEFAVTGDGEVKLKNITDTVKDFGKQAEDSAKQATGAFSNFLGTLAALGIWDLFKEGAKKVYEFGKEAIHSAEEQEKANIRLSESLLATGKYTQKTVDSLKAWADEMQYATGIQDEVIINSQAMIQSLAALDEKGLKRATQAAIDLSKGMGIDLQRASEMLGRAAIGNTEVLRRQGIVIAETGNVAKDFEKALGAIEARYGGRAQAEAETYGGALKRISITFGEFQESVGLALLTNQSLINVLNVAAKMFGDLGRAMNANKATIAVLISDGVLTMIKAFQISIDVIQGVQKVILYASLGFLKYAELVLNMSKYVTLGLVNLGEAADTAKDLAKGMVEELDSFDRGDRSLSKVNAALAEFAKAAEKGYGKSTEGAKELEYQNKATHISFTRLTDAQKALIDQGKQLIQAEREKADPFIEFERKKAAIDAYIAYDKSKRAEGAAAITQLEKDTADKATALRLEVANKYLAENDALIAADQYKNSELIELNRQKAQAIINTEANQNKAVLEAQKKTIDQTKAMEDKQKSDRIATINYVATLQNAKSKELQIIGKAAAISTATIDGILAVQKALASFPPPFNFIMAGLVGAATAANVARISGVELATGITEVPAGYPNDTFPARLTSGERVVDAGTNQDLKAYLANTGGMSAQLARIADRLERLENRVVVNIGSKVIVDEVRESLRQGRAINV